MLGVLRTRARLPAAFLAAAWSLAPSPADARPHGYAERVYTTDDGLSQSQVTSLSQDDDGYLWIATGNGIDRFDGVTFKRFGEDDGLPCLSFDEVRAVPGGRVWMGCAGALAVRDAKGFHAVTLPPGTSTGSLNAFVDAGAMAIAAFGPSIVRLTSAGATRVDAPEETRASSTVTLAATRDFGVLAAGKYGLLQLDAAGQRADFATGVLAPLAHEPIVTMTASRDGRVWISTASRGLLEVSDGRVTRIGEREGLGQVACLAADPARHELWVGSFDGLWRVDDARHVERMGAAGQSVRTVAVDREGDVWFSAPPELHELTPAKFDVLTTADGLPDGFVQPIVHARDGSVWIGTGKGVVRLQDGHVTTFGKADGLTNIGIQALVEDAAGRIVAGASPGLFAFDGRRFVSLAGVAEEGRWIYGASARADGTIWLATSRGLATLAGERIVQDRVDGLLDHDVFSVTEDLDHRVWLTYTHHTGATTLLPDGTVHHLEAKVPGRQAASGASVFVDSKRRVWMPSDQGLLRLDQEPPRVFGVHEGMPDDNVYSVLEDAGGDLWVNTDGGVARFDGEKVLARYTTSDGLAANEGNSGAAAKDPSGRLWFGSTGGVSIIDPRHIPKNELPPRVLVEAARFGDRSLAASDVPAEVPFRDNNVRFDFTAPTFRGPRAVRFDYRLHGFDGAWTAMELPVLQRHAAYTNLPAGDYVFEVRATNEDGVPSVEPARVRFRVVPPWWRRWWAWTAYAAALMAAGSLATLSRTRALRRRAAELEASVKSRTQQLDAKIGELAERNDQLTRLNAELVASHERADRIFSALAEALPGTVLDGKYRLDERIGIGGFGAVFRAAHLDLRRSVAVKVFRPAAGNDSPQALERFRREAITASKVRHPNAVSVFDSGISKEGIAYLVMELLDGESLASVLQREGTLSLARTVAIVKPVCAALQAAHDAGIIHRDMKPENVVLHHDEDGNEVIKVVDFGIARLVDDEGATRAADLTGSKTLLGTPAYIAPERLTGHPYDGRADVYSVGVMAYEMICGVLPHDPLATDPRGPTPQIAYVARALSSSPHGLAARLEAIPREVDTAILRALTPTPALRPTAAAFAEELEASLRGLSREALEERFAASSVARLEMAPTTSVSGRPPPGE